MQIYRAHPKTNTQKLNEITDKLPEFTYLFFYSGTSGKAILTRIAYGLDIRYFFEYGVKYYPYFPNKPVKELNLDDIRQIKAQDIDDYITWMREEKHLSERTCARRRSSISVLFEYLINTERKLDYNPVSGSATVEIPESESVSYLTLEEQEKLLECIRNGTGFSKRQLSFQEKYRKRDLAIIFLFLDTGLRISELQALNVFDVVIYEDPFDEKKNECYVTTLRRDKNDIVSTAKVYFSDESKEYIQDYLEQRKERRVKIDEHTALFTTLEGKRLSVREIQHMLRKYIAVSLNRSDISVNKLRSSFAMEFYRHEKNILALQQRMGHKSISATNVYARAIDREEKVKESRNWRGR